MKKNGFLVFLRVVLIVVLSLILLLCAWLCFSAFNKKSPLNYIPSEYSLFVRTDNVWKAAEPMLDLKACDTFLADKSFGQVRKVFMNVKASPLRKNPAVKFALGRKAHVAFYTDKNQQMDFVAALDLSFLSGATRLLPLAGDFVFKKINQPGIEYVKHSEDFETYGFDNFIRIKTGENSASTIYAKPCKNLVIVASSLQMFKKAFSGENYNDYSSQDKINLVAKCNEPFKIIADSKKLITSFTETTGVTEDLLKLLKDNEQSIVEFGINDYEINIKARVPFDFENSADSSLVPVLRKNSTLPVIVSQLPDEVQYYTLINIAQLQDLKESAFPLVKTKTDINKLWAQADGLSKTALNASLEDILFSWTGKELAVFGLEGNKEPVFAVQITDELQRRKVFDSVFSSFLISNNSSLIVGGVRLPCMELPSFLVNLLSAFGIDLPSPYYLVIGDYIYFSESPRNLSILYNSIKNSQFLSRTENFKTISTNQNSLSSVELFYNLERSLPFFVQSGTPVAKVLKLYNIGRVGVRIKDESLYFSLHAASVEQHDLKMVPGFPVNAGGRTDYVLLKKAEKNSRRLYWLENRQTIKYFDMDTFEVNSQDISQNCSIKIASSKTKKDGAVWVSCANGAVYLLDKNLEPCDNFPVMLENRPVADSAVASTSLIVPCQNNTVYIVSEEGYVQETVIPNDVNIKSSPAVYENYAVMYDKSFDGGILIYDVQGQTFETIEIDEIASGTPGVAKYKSSMYIGFVTQSGLFYLLKDKKIADGFPLQIENVFSSKTNAVFFDGYFFVFADDATLYRISLDGQILSLKIPDGSSAYEGFITPVQDGENRGLYVCADSNIIYGFTKDLEVINDFPVAGCGVPVFSDVNNDGKTDVVVLSVDKKLYSWTIK